MIRKKVFEIIIWYVHRFFDFIFFFLSFPQCLAYDGADVNDGIFTSNSQLEKQKQTNKQTKQQTNKQKE